MKIKWIADALYREIKMSAAAENPIYGPADFFLG
jgi:hypothetical protein